MGFGFKRCVGQLPTGASNNMSVEPTTLPQGRAVLGSGLCQWQDQATNHTGVEFFFAHSRKFVETNHLGISPSN
jgi:hypothetical protein